MGKKNKSSKKPAEEQPSHDTKSESESNAEPQQNPIEESKESFAAEVEPETTASHSDDKVAVL